MAGDPVSRNLVTVKTRTGFIRVPAPKPEKPAKAMPVEEPTAIVGEAGPEMAVGLPAEPEPAEEQAADA